MIRWVYAFIDRPLDRFEQSSAFWTAVTGTGRSAPRGEQGEFLTLLPQRAGADAHLKLQGVDGDGGAHLDLAVDDYEVFRSEAVASGAVVVADHGSWVVLRSPGGQLFCVMPWDGAAERPEPEGGVRLDQVAIDLAPSVFDAETDFWAGLTGWGSERGSRPEFRMVRPPAGAGIPVQILLHRLEEERPTSAHLDLACADVAETTALHLRLGAEVVRREQRWTVMRDPAGGTYCLTSRDPDTGRLPTTS
ncbi:MULTISPECIES: VOC family protein [Streptacidiphilus]|uniref:VOC family protein n=1 Tax=Streptacidiphilus cavernicola TaxID=3342716 RepID=A0ABV6UFB3_9ACTN|nr:VOC family protein [Streptacidiphilus jeojiense]